MSFNDISSNQHIIVAAFLSGSSNNSHSRTADQSDTCKFMLLFCFLLKLISSDA